MASRPSHHPCRDVTGICSVRFPLAPLSTADIYAGNTVGILTCRGAEHRGSRSRAGTGDRSCASRRRFGRAARSTLRTTKLHLSPAPPPMHGVHEKTATRAVPPPIAPQALRFTTATPRRNPERRAEDGGQTLIDAGGARTSSERRSRCAATLPTTTYSSRAADFIFFAPPPRREQLLRRPGFPATPGGCGTHAVWGARKPARRNNAHASEDSADGARARHTRM